MSERRRPKTQKTLAMRDADSTHVGAAPPGWEGDATTTVGTPVGWEMNTAPDVEDVRHEWEVERTVEEQSPAAQRPKKPSRPPVRAADKTHIGPPPNFDLGGGQKVAAPEPSSPVAAPRAERPPIEVEVRKLSAASARRMPPAYEVWTKNRVYALDPTLICVDVIDLATGQSDKKHPFMGGQLVGGQRRVNDNNELTFPLPTPGSEAVFQTYDANRRPRLVVTSKVTRVILHVQIVRVDERQKDDTWGAIASTRRPT